VNGGERVGSCKQNLEANFGGGFGPEFTCSRGRRPRGFGGRRFPHRRLAPVWKPAPTRPGSATPATTRPSSGRPPIYESDLRAHWPEIRL